MPLARFLVPIKPRSNEQGTYNRASVGFLFTARPINWTWGFSGSMPTAGWPRLRLLVDGAPVTGWITPATNSYPFVFDVPDGHHIASVEGADGFAQVMQKPFCLNTTGAPLPLALQKPWAAPTRLETDKATIGPPAQFVWTGALPVPKVWPLKIRDAVPYSTRLPKSALWAMSPVENWSAMMRRFASLPSGDVAIEEYMKYPIGEAESLGENKPGLEASTATARDGPRGVGTQAYIGKLLVRRGGIGVYFAETTGRFGFISFRNFRPVPADKDASKGQTDHPLVAGETMTFAGLRVKPGQPKGHAAFSGSRPWYESTHEMVGDWSRVPGPKRFHELWGFAIARKMPDGSIDNRDGLEAWLCDTLNHRVLFANMWPGHPAVYRAADFAPVGYVSPPEPTGTTQLVPFAGNADGTPSDLCNEPWGIVVRPQDKKIYWTNHGGNSIARSNMDGSGKEVFIRCSKNPTNAQLGIPKRLYPGYSPASLRASYLIDGPRGTATCVRPQDLGLDSDGNLIFVERYTQLIKKYDFATDLITTLAHINGLSLTTSSSSAHEISMSIDSEGTCGPRDDMFLSFWAGPGARYSKEGVYVEQWNYQSGADLRNGPWDRVAHTNYTWGVAVGDGNVITAGNGGGSRLLRIVPRLPTDQAMNSGLYQQGAIAYNASPMYITHGLQGRGELGYPYIDEIGSWDDATVRAYGTANGIPADALDGYLHWIRCNTADIDYGVAVAPTPVPPVPVPVPIPVPTPVPPAPAPVPVPPPVQTPPPAGVSPDGPIAVGITYTDVDGGKWTMKAIPVGNDPYTLYRNEGATGAQTSACTTARIYRGRVRCYIRVQLRELQWNTTLREWQAVTT